MLVSWPRRMCKESATGQLAKIKAGTHFVQTVIDVASRDVA